MRNALVFFLCLSFIASGCSQSYSGERFFWKAQKVSASVLKDPAKATPEQYSKAIDAYGKVIAKLPGTEWAGKAQLSIGTLYQYQKKYSKAREKYALVLQDYHRFQLLCVSARMAVGKSYEAEKRWDDAVKAYRELTDYHSWTLQGLQAPLYVAAVYEKRKEQAQALRSYESAISWYKKLILNAPSKDLEASAKAYLAVTYQQLRRWSEAAETLEQIVDSKGVDRAFILMNLGHIYQKNLGNPKKAEEVLSKLIREFPRHPYAKIARNQLEKIKIENTAASTKSQIAPSAVQQNAPAAPAAQGR